jgi:FkbM family methyltransferase
MDEALNARKEFGLLQHRLRRHVGPAARAELLGRFTEALIEEPATVETPRGPLYFVILNKTSARRAATLLTKQPATLAWIDRFAPESTFWDIGANVGVYTLYAALRPDVRVVAFEPVAVNYFLLAANCEVNRIEARVAALPLALGVTCETGRIEASQFKAGKSFSFHGKPDEPYGSHQAALLMSIDSVVDLFAMPIPRYVKIDVPGMTEAVLAGGARMLEHPDLRELHIELDDDAEAARITARLHVAGFTLATRDVHRQSADATFVRRG